MTSRPMPPELADLIQRVARHPHGLGFLHQAYVDSVAVTLGVHPFVVDAARAYLETRPGRLDLIELVRLELKRPPASTSHEPGDAPSCQREVEGLIREAENDSRGVDDLDHAPLEEVAERFGVHPYLVLRARGVLERKRLEREHSVGPAPPSG